VRLHYGDPQIAIGVVFAVLALLLASAFLVIGVQAGSDVSVERVHRVGYWLRKRWLALLVVIGVLVLGISFFDLPYASGGSAGRTSVTVTGGQFFWSLQPDRVPAGSRVRFDVTSVDVNHGFGLYDPHGHLIPERNGAIAARAEVVLAKWACGVPAVISSVSDRDAADLREMEKLGLRPGTVVRVEAGTRSASLLVRIGEGASLVRLSQRLAEAISVVGS